MIKVRIFILAVWAFVILAAGIAIMPSSLSAQEDNAPARGQLESLPPVLDRNAPVPNVLISEMFKQCRSVYPRRFTPSALDYYCNCAAAAAQGTMTAGEFSDLQRGRNRVISNQVYQKYITNVVAPCLEAPAVEIEYFSCVLDRYNDPRLNNIPKYCTCVSNAASAHIRDYGDMDILITMANKRRINDPFEALWINEKYRQAVEQGKTRCLSQYITTNLPPRQ